MKYHLTLAALVAALLACAAFAPQVLPLALIGGGAVLIIHRQSRLCPVSNSIAEDLLTIPSGCSLSRVTEAAFTKHALAYEGSSAGGVRVCGASNVPIGPVSVDGSDVAIASGDRVNVHRLHSGQPCLVIASGSVSRGDRLYTAASGKVSTLSASAATYYLVGEALTAAADGELLVLNPCAPQKVVVS